MSEIYGMKQKNPWSVMAKVESSSRDLDGLAKYAQSWFGIFELPNMPGLSKPVKNFNKILKQFIEWNKGTYGAISRFDEWLPDANGKLYWDRKKKDAKGTNGKLEVTTQIFMTVVSCFDVVGLFQSITGGAKLGFTARTVHSSAFFGGMTLTVVGSLDPLKKSQAEKEISAERLEKWTKKEELFRKGASINTDLVQEKEKLEAELRTILADRKSGYSERVAELKKSIKVVEEKLKIQDEYQKRLDQKIKGYESTLNEITNELEQAEKELRDVVAKNLANEEQVNVKEKAGKDQKTDNSVDVQRDLLDKIEKLKSKQKNILEKLARYKTILVQPQTPVKGSKVKSLVDGQLKSALGDHAQVKIAMWQRQLIIAKSDVRQKWFDIAKTVAKAVQLIFSVVIMTLGTVTLSVLVADAVVKFAMGQFSLASLLNKEFKPEVIHPSFLPKDFTSMKAKNCLK